MNSQSFLQRAHQSFMLVLGVSSFLTTVDAQPALMSSMISPITGFQLNTAGTYQPISGEALTTLQAEQPSFCQSPRPDARPLYWQDAAGQSQQWSFSNESGVLRWWSGTSSQQLIWAEGSKLIPATETVSNQLAIVASASAPHRLTVVWPEPALQRYSAVDLTEPQQPKALWQWQAPWTGSVQTPIAATLKTTTGVHQAMLMVSGADAVQPGFWLIDAISGKPIAAQQYQRLIKTVELPFVLQDLVAAPAALDRNADGYTDRIYLVDAQGRLVQADLDPQLQVQSRVVADLADAAAQFKVQVVASRALLPDAQVSASNAGVVDPNDEASSSDGETTVGAAGQAADVVILLSSKNEQSQLWVLIIPDSPAYTIQPHHLMQRDLTTDELPALTMTNATIGWYGTLPAAPVSLPQVFAGVLYIAVAPTADTCADARRANRLVAKHLFQGSSVYTSEQLATIPTPFGLPGAVIRSSGELALQDLPQGTLLLPQIFGIRADCRFCTEVLQHHDVPKGQRMAIFQHESEVYR